MSMPPDGGQQRVRPRRWTHSTRASTISRCCGRSASGPCWRRSTSRMRSRPGCPPARWWPETRSSSNRPRLLLWPGMSWRAATSMPGFRPASSTSSPVRARRSAKRWHMHPDVDGVIFTGSKEVGLELFKRFSTDFPKPCITEMGGKNPTIVTANADIDKAVEGVARVGVRLFRSEVLGLLPRLRRAAGLRRVHRPSSPTARRRSRSAIRTERDTYVGPVIDEQGGRAVRSGPWPRRRAARFAPVARG